MVSSSRHQWGPLSLTGPSVSGLSSCYQVGHCRVSKPWHSACHPLWLCTAVLGSHCHMALFHMWKVAKSSHSQEPRLFKGVTSESTCTYFKLSHTSKELHDTEHWEDRTMILQRFKLYLFYLYVTCMCVLARHSTRIAVSGQCARL